MIARLLKDGAAIGLIRLIGAGLAFALTLFLTRSLKPAEFGMYSYALALIMILNVPVSNGWAILILRRVGGAKTPANWREAKGLIQTGNRAAAVICGLVLAFGFLVIHFSQPEFLTYGIAALLVGVMFFDQLSALRLAALRGLNHPVLGQMPEMVVRPVFIMMVMLGFGAFVLPDLSVIHAFWALLAAAAASAAIGGLFLRRNQPAELLAASPGFQTGNWMKSAAFIAANSGLVIVNAQLDVLFLGIMGSLDDVGIYRVAVQIALLASFTFTALNLLAGQRFAALRSAQDWRGLQITARFLARLAMLGALPLPLLFLFAGPMLLNFLFGPEFSTALQPLLILSLGHVVATLFGMGGIFLLIAGREREIIGFTVAALMLNGLLCLWLIPLHSASGAAIAMAVSRVFWVASVWGYTLFKERMDISVLGLWSGRPHPS